MEASLDKVLIKRVSTVSRLNGIEGCVYLSLKFAVNNKKILFIKEFFFKLKSISINILSLPIFKNPFLDCRLIRIVDLPVKINIKSKLSHRHRNFNKICYTSKGLRRSSFNWYFRRCWTWRCWKYLSKNLLRSSFSLLYCSLIYTCIHVYIIIDMKIEVKIMTTFETHFYCISSL